MIYTYISTNTSIIMLDDVLFYSDDCIVSLSFICNIYAYSYSC